MAEAGAAQLLVGSKKQKFLNCCKCGTWLTSKIHQGIKECGALPAFFYLHNRGSGLSVAGAVLMVAAVLVSSVWLAILELIMAALNKFQATPD